MAVALRAIPLSAAAVEEPPALIEHIPALRRYALFLSQDRDRADDLVQECLTRAIANLDRFQHGTNLRAWLLAILRNYYFNNDIRRGGRERQWASEEEERAHHPVSLASQTDAIALHELEQALLALPEEQREVLLLVGAEGMSYEEVAARQHVTVGTIKSRVNRARHHLADILGLGPEDAVGTRFLHHESGRNT